MSAAAPVFCSEEVLTYRRSLTPFAPGEGLVLDEAYRLAHLPLVAPDHPGVIAAMPGRFYERGRHSRVVSLVLPVPYPDLAAAPAYAALNTELRAAPFAHKIAWDVATRRRVDTLERMASSRGRAKEEGGAAASETGIASASSEEEEEEEEEEDLTSGEDIHSHLMARAGTSHA